MASNMNKRAALFYASLGWPVFPVWPIRDGVCACGTACGKNRGKHPVSDLNNSPVVPRGLNDATTNPARIKSWWERIPDANIGCVGFKWFAVDVDDNDAFDMLTDEYGNLPDTVTQFSSSGGTHFLFNQPQEKLGSSRGQLPKGIDVRGHNGYLLMAPSRVKGDYEWEISSKPSENEIADAPQWLINLIRPTEARVKFGTDAPVDFNDLDISSITLSRITTPPSDDTDRSSIDQMVVNALVSSGLSDEQIRYIYNTYPIGTAGKYAEKEQHGDGYLALTVSKARAYVQSPTVKISKAIPGKVITNAEARVEAVVLRMKYEQGWNDALLENTAVLEAMWPGYLGFDDDGLAKAMVGLYDLGLRQDFSIDDTEREFPALVVPITSATGAVTNLDYSLYGVPPGIDLRQFEGVSAPLFIADTGQVGRPRMLVFDDWDVAAYVYLKMSHKLPKDVAITALTAEASLAGMKASQLSPLLALANQSEQVIFVTHLKRQKDAGRLAAWVGRDKSRWIGWPLSSREMFKDAGMDGKKLERALRSSIPVA